jgi:hypothetical protein
VKEGDLCYEVQGYENVYDDAQLQPALIASRRLIIGI